MTTTFAGHLLTGDHASRPAFGSVPQGTLYSCTDHDLVYQSDGVAAWSTWATLGAAIADILDLPTAETGTTKVLKPDGAGGVVWGADATGGGGGGGSTDTPHFYQAVRTNGDATISAIASGRRLIVAITSYGGTVTGVACTNVTFTQVGTDLSFNGNKTSVWVGVATGTSGTTVSFTGSGTILNCIVEVDDALTPTLDAQSSVTQGSAYSFLSHTFQPTAGSFVVAIGMTDSTGPAVATLLTTPYTPFPPQTSVQATSLACGYAVADDISAMVLSSGGSSGAIYFVSIL